MSELRFETYSMPAADLGPENPLPPLASKKDVHAMVTGPDIPPEMARNMVYGHLPNIMPYSVQDNYTRTRLPRDFRVAILENETLKATFLLELGGRLWSLYHKPTQRELLSVNPVFQPANLALRNAWFSGGVEWNIATIGHSPFTCAPLFVARLDTPEGIPVLRMYEWERIRQVPFQIDAWLPDSSQALFVRVRIVNPHDYTVPMYWWSNMAVPERPNTRVIVPADSAYRFAYEAQGLALIPTPAYQGQDYTYPAQIQNSADYFFHVPDGKRPWIAALDEDGKGLIQVSTPRLKGRKLFVWGMGRGGRRWQEFLAPGGNPYIEIQAGLARTQMEHLPMPPRADWSWLEAYGLVEANPSLTHSNDWPMAVQSVEDVLDQLIPEAKLEAEYQRGSDFQDQPPTEIFQYGSGWGHLEALRRKASSESSFSLTGLVFPNDSLSEDQSPWVELLQNGVLPAPNPDSDSPGFIIQQEWKDRLEQSIQLGNANWYAWYQLGIMRAYADDRDGARRASQESLRLETNPWAMRNLALLALEGGHHEDAVSLYLGTVRLKPELIPLAVECGKVLLHCGQFQKWLDLASELPLEVHSVGRIQLLVAQASLAMGDFESVERFFENEVVIPDIREGEVALSDFWFEYQIKRLSSREHCAVNDKFRAQVYRDFPVPAHLDFRMKTEHKTAK
jgi:tetratricopeptide (TPR) repeat protein